MSCQSLLLIACLSTEDGYDHQTHCQQLPCAYYCATSIKAPLFSFCFHHCVAVLLRVILHLLSLLLNINDLYANGLTPAEVVLAPPLNVNLLSHLHFLKCQIPPQIIAGASVRRGQCPLSDGAETMWPRRTYSIKSTSKPV